MVVRNRVTKKIYQCSQADAAKIINRSTRTLHRWEHEQNLKSKYVGIYEVTFSPVKKIVQKKGFALKPFKKAKAEKV